MPPSLDDMRQLARRWILLAAGSLVLSGSLSLLLVVGRMPGLDRLVGDPLIFKRGLVVHVGLALVVWFYAFVAGLFSLLPARNGPGLPARAGPFVSAAGVVLLVAAALVPGAQPLLSNYVPMIDHPLYAAGWLVFAAGVASTLLGRRLLPSRDVAVGPIQLPDAARCALRTAALCVIFALLTVGAAWLVTPTDLLPEAYYEAIFWGGGHVLQFASSAAMVAVWLVLLAPIAGEAILSRRTATALFGLLLLPVIGAPFLALHGTLDPAYRLGFTRMMQWGIFPAVSIALLLCVAALVRARRAGRLDLRDDRFLGFATSAALTVVGFVLGAMIRGSTTMVPAHYHAAIGAVTAAFMAITYPLLAPLGIGVLGPLQRRLARWQPLVFGTGQLVFAVGFGLAGGHGMARKVYGAEQVRRSLGETAGLLVMGLGGLLAVVGGLAFLALVITAWRRSQSAESRSEEWIRKSGSIPSRS